MAARPTRVPQRLRPGFWDNDGRCCGTAGVGDILLDAAQSGFADERDSAEYARHALVMGDALVGRAIVDGDGAHWRFVEHRQDPPLLASRTSWMPPGSPPTCCAELARFVEDGLATAAGVDRPEQWWAVPERLRVVNAPPHADVLRDQRAQRRPAAPAVTARSSSSGSRT
ncbi:hypothetical protein [Dactylosporangium sp. NPDC051484]|uniref:hypothetical protein n=1 Tax=Dactylosporangium sp. NPDC051484 TaxID=3154942 RepID=UPI00344D0D27